jgi:hypothetical protein
MNFVTFPTGEKKSSKSRGLILFESCIQKTVRMSLSSGVNSGDLCLLGGVLECLPREELRYDRFLERDLDLYDFLCRDLLRDLERVLDLRRLSLSRLLDLRLLFFSRDLDRDFFDFLFDRERDLDLFLCLLLRSVLLLRSLRLFLLDSLIKNILNKIKSNVITRIERQCR